MERSKAKSKRLHLIGSHHAGTHGGIVSPLSVRGALRGSQGRSGGDVSTANSIAISAQPRNSAQEPLRAPEPRREYNFTTDRGESPQRALYAQIGLCRNAPNNEATKKQRGTLKILVSHFCETKRGFIGFFRKTYGIELRTFLSISRGFTQIRVKPCVSRSQAYKYTSGARAIVRKCWGSRPRSTNQLG